MKTISALFVLSSGLLVLGGVGLQPAPGPGAFAQAKTITGIGIPEGYRGWKILAASHRLDKEEIRLILANETAWKASLNSVLPFPEGSVIAKLAYKAKNSEEWGEAIIPGEAQRLEFMVKDSKKYADTGGWGFGRFVQGKPVGDKDLYDTCFPCHRLNVKDQDFVFTRLAR